MDVTHLPREFTDVKRKVKRVFPYDPRTETPSEIKDKERKFLLANYTGEDKKMYHKGVSDVDEAMLDRIGCRCNPPIICPICYLREKRAEQDLIRLLIRKKKSRKK